MFKFLLILIVLSVVVVVGGLVILGSGATKHHGLGVAEWATERRMYAISLAEWKFQNDHDYDAGHPGSGEFGLFDEIRGMVPVQGHTVSLLDGEFQPAQSEQCGYCFVIYLPSSTHSAISDPRPVQPTADGAHLRERYWVAYAWPLRPDRTIPDYPDYPPLPDFAVDQDGKLYVHVAATTPAPLPWDSLYGAAGWGHAPAEGWVPYTR
jgi:hypothetical protein